MASRDDQRNSDTDKTPAGERSIPRGTDEHSDPKEQRQDDRSATTRPRSETRDTNDMEQDL